MSQKNETVPLILALLVTAAILGGGAWWFLRSGVNGNDLIQGNDGNTINSPTPDSTALNNTNETFPPPTSVPNGTTVQIGGSTSMVQINQALKNSFEQQFPGATVETQASGSTKGIEGILEGNLDIAATSRPLRSQEEAQGLVEIPLTQDAIAIVVGANNPFRRGLTNTEVVNIFQGNITNWSEVGGENRPIRVINRPPISGTHQAFQELVLKGETFGTTPNIETMERDATTPLLQSLQTDGIGYATYTQVADQQSVRTVPIDGLTPEANNYPYQRTLYYVYREPATPEVKAFLGFASSPKGQQIILNAN